MEHCWTKKRIALLLQGDHDSLELFLSQYEPVLFTWLYYQVGADANIAADLTARTFVGALHNLKEFDPRDTTMFQWLREQARLARDEGLLHWQLKPQRPWAWSQLSDSLLKSLAGLRSDLLGEPTAANPFVQEMVQATLAELEQIERELMMHRYSHLDTPENIASEVNLTVEKVNDLLYKCRHSFRRVFFQLISSVNPGFSETNAGTGIEVLDNNLEKLLRATGMYQSPSESQQTMIRERIFEAAHQAAHLRPKAKSISFPLVATGAAIVLVLTAGAVFLLNRSETPSDVPGEWTPDSRANNENNPAKPDTAKPPATQQDVNEEELTTIFELGQAGNLAALLEILKSGHFTSQLAAAHFIGKLGTPTAIELLEEAENQWYPNGPKNNPFAEAIAEIARRYPDQVRISETPAAAGTAQPQTAEVKPVVTSVEGYVRDALDKPVTGARIELYTNPIFSEPSSVLAAQGVSNQNGQYAIEKSLEGPFFLKCTYTGNEHVISQAIWCEKGDVQSYNFGGKGSLAGKISLNQRHLSGLKLFLCDSLEPSVSGFRAETSLNATGEYLFTGLSEGLYNLFGTTEDKKLILFSSLGTSGNGLVSFNLDLQPVTLIAECTEPNALAGGILSLRIEPSTESEHKTARVLDDGRLLFENVLAGTYVLKTQINHGYQVQQTIETTAGIDEQVITIELPTGNTVDVSGKIIGQAPAPLLLVSLDERVWADLAVNADGSYELTGLPSDTYRLGAFVRGRLVEFSRVDLTGSTEILMDLELDKIISPLSPAFIIVTNRDGLIVSGARVWLTGGNETMIVESTGQGAFLAAPAGEYMLHAAHEQYGSASKDIVLKKMPLASDAGAENTFQIELQ